MRFVVVLCLLVLTCSLVSCKTISNFQKTANNRNNAKKLLELRGGSAVEELSKLDWRFFVAGGLCAATSHGITTPLDVIKTKMQTDPEKYNQGMLNTLQIVYKEEGWKALFRGIEPRVMWIGIGGFVFFGAYEKTKQILTSL